jgi:hypothetical protein
MAAVSALRTPQQHNEHAGLDKYADSMIPERAAKAVYCRQPIIR